jgi:hypothetical protein
VLARFFLLLILFVVIAKMFWRFIDGVVSGAMGGAPHGGKRAAPRGGPPASVKMSQCPVCGTYVVPGKAISIVSGGTPLYFDTEKCRAEYQSR